MSEDKATATRLVKHKIIDVSSNNGHIDFHKVARAGVFGAYIKATEGQSYVDPHFAEKAAAARHAGLHVGFYHFARPDHNSPSDDVHNFLQHARRPRKGDLRPVLDFETAGHRGHSNMVAWARDFSQRYHHQTGVWPLFYSYPYFIQSMNPSYPIGGGLWLASYGANDGRRHHASPPSPWKRILLHQFTSNGRVAGVSGNVDVSYAGTPSALVIK